MSVLWVRYDEQGEPVDNGVLHDEARPDIADLVHGIDTEYVIIARKGGGYVQYTRGPEPEGDMP